MVKRPLTEFRIVIKVLLQLKQLHRGYCQRDANGAYEVGESSNCANLTRYHCGSEAGHPLPPFIRIKENCLVKIYHRAYTGHCMWSQCIRVDGKENFSSWFIKVFPPTVETLLSTGEVIPKLDGHHSLINPFLIKETKSTGVYLVCLQSNIT